MKKLIKIVFAVAVLLGLFLVGSILLFNQLAKPQVFKEQLIKVVYLKTGRELAINGKISLSIFPHLSVIMRDVTLNNAKYFTDKNFAHANKIEARVETLPLFTGKVKINKFVFKGFNLNLERKNFGINNWQDLFQHEASQTAADVEQQAKLPELYFANIELNNAVISLDDQRVHKQIVLSELHLDSLGMNLSGAPFLVTACGKFASNVADVGGDFIFRGNIIFNWQKQIYFVKGLDFCGNISGGALRQRVNFGANADIIVDFAKQEIAIDNLRLRLANMVALGNMRATNVVYAPNVAGEIDIAAFDPKPLLYAVGVLPQQNIAAATKLTSNAKKKKLLQSKAEDAWQTVALKANWQTTSKFLKIPNLKLSLNDTTLQGSANYSHFGNQLVVFDFDIDHLDLDRYHHNKEGKTKNVVKPSASAIQSTIAQTAASFAAAPVGDMKVNLLSKLREVVLNGDIRIGDLKMSNMHIHDLDMQVSDENGMININPFSGKFYDGTIDGSVGIDVQKDIPAMLIVANMKNVSTGQLIKDLANTTANKLDGIAMMQVKLTALGDTLDAMLKNLRGTGHMRIVNGTFYGIDIRYQIDKVKGLINGAMSSMKESQPPRTNFSQLTGNFKIVDGIANTNDLFLEAPDFNFKVRGKGNANLITKKLDLQLDAAYLDHANFYVPIKVSGNFTKPNIQPDVAVFMGQLLGGDIAKEVDKASKSGAISVQTNKNGSKSVKIDANKLMKSLKINDKKLRDLLQ